MTLIHGPDLNVAPWIWGIGRKLEGDISGHTLAVFRRGREREEGLGLSLRTLSNFYCFFFFLMKLGGCLHYVPELWIIQQTHNYRAMLQPSIKTWSWENMHPSCWNWSECTVWISVLIAKIVLWNTQKKREYRICSHRCYCLWRSIWPLRQTKQRS